MAFDFTLWSIVGALGIALIELSYVPQINRLFRLKQADDISLLFPALNLSGRVLALIYALGVAEDVFALGFIVGIVLRGTLMFQVIWYRYLKAWTARNDASVSQMLPVAMSDPK